MLKEISKSEYDEKLKNIEFYTLFHTTEWIETIKQIYPWIKEKYYSNGEFIFPVMEKGDKLVSMPLCEYGGVIGDGDFEKIKEEIKEKFEKKGKKYLIKIHPLVNNEKDSKLNSYILDLKKVDENYLTKLRQTTRHSVRKSLKNNLKFSECDNNQDLKKFYKLYLNTMKKNKTFAKSYNLFSYILKNKNCKIYLAKHEGKIICGVVILVYGDVAHYFLAASDYKYNKLLPNYFLVWNAIHKSKEKCKFFDFGGTREGSRLEIFKKGWVTKKYPITTITNVEDNYEDSFVRKIWGKLPIYLIEKLSPHVFKRIF